VPPQQNHWQQTLFKAQWHPPFEPLPDLRQAWLALV